MWQLPQKETERRNNSSKGSLVRQLKFHDGKIKLHNLIKPSTVETTTTMTLLYWVRTADYLRSSVLLIWIFPILRALCSSTSRHFDIVFKKRFFLFNWPTTTRVQWRQPEEKRVKRGDREGKISKRDSMTVNYNRKKKKRNGNKMLKFFLSI